MILGKVGSKAKDVYESKISLASRIVKVERSVEDIETKMDNMLEMFIEDRARLQNMFRIMAPAFGQGPPYQPGPPSSSGGNSGGGGGGSGGGTIPLTGSCIFLILGWSIWRNRIESNLSCCCC